MAVDGSTFDRRVFVATLLAGAVATLVIFPAFADRRSRNEREDDDDDDDYDHEAARRARATGEIAPLSEILKHIRKTRKGEVVEVELEREDGRWLYEIKLITPKNRYLEIYVDAKTKAILKVEGE